MDDSELAMHLAKASAAAERAAESVRRLSVAIGPVTRQLQQKMRPFAAAHLELEQRRRDFTTPQD